MKSKEFFTLSIICLILGACNGEKTGTLLSERESIKNSDYLTVDEAMQVLKVPEAAAKFTPDTGSLQELPPAFRPPYVPVEPVKLFDNLYFSGTNAVGSFIIDSGEGLVMFDTGCGDEDASLIVEGIRKLGLDPSTIKLIFISHEHFDHYGGVRYLKENVCPDAKVAMSLTGWNMLQTVPSEWAYIGRRPESVDIYLTDGMKIKYGTAYIQVVATPGHSPGCVSFIFPVTDNGEKHMAGVMGGMGVWPTQVEARLYKSSIEYYKAFAEAAGCDVGLFFHSREKDFTAIHNRKSGEPNPMVIGKKGFDSVYLQKYRDTYMQVLNSGRMIPYPII
jgi:metallo-beta-lactamase class B